MSPGLRFSAIARCRVTRRTYFSQAENGEVFLNGVTTSMEYERQMTWQISSGFLRTLGYIFPRRTFKYEVHELVKDFLSASQQPPAKPEACEL